MAMINNATYFDFVRIAAAGNGAIPAFNPADDFNSTVVGGTLLFGGASALFQGGSWLWQNKGNYASAWQTARQNAVNAKTPNALKAHGNFFTNPFTNKYYWQKINNLEGRIINQPSQLNYSELMKNSDKNIEKLRTANNMNFMKARHYLNAKKELARIKQLAKEGKLYGKEFKTALKEANRMLYKAELDVLKDTNIKPTGFWGKSGYYINKYTGTTWAKKKFLKAATKEGSTNAAKATRFAGRAGREFIRHGGPLTFLIEMGCEVPEIAKTYSKLGAGKGTKQLAKSTAVAGASTAGFVLGAKAGGILGAKIGTAVGAWFGGIGTVPGAIIGSIVGIGCGLLGSWGARQIAKAAVGPTELEKAQNRTTNDLAWQMAFNKDKQLSACSDLYIKAKKGEIQLDQSTVASLERILAGREKEFAKYVEKNMPKEELNMKA